MKYGQELPIEVETKLDAYIERIKAINWFKPQNPKREEIEKAVNFVVECF